MNSSITIRPAIAEEASDLRNLARRSKSHWGYDIELLDLWESEDAFTPDARGYDAGFIFVAEGENGTLLGWYELSGEIPSGELSGLWIDPEAIGHGIGKKLFEHACARAYELGFTTLKIDADPNAEGFYLHMGAQRIGETSPNPITKRTLPVLSLSLPMSFTD